MTTKQEALAAVAALRTSTEQRYADLRQTVDKLQAYIDHGLTETRGELDELHTLINDIVATPVSSIPGDPGPGKIRWGASHPTSVDPVVRYEQPAGVPLGVHRTFWGWAQTGMVTAVKADHAAGRVPWISMKTPGWQRVANGLEDTDLTATIAALKATGKPVWLTVHHEPEDDVERNEQPGGIPAWRNMQQKVRSVIDQVGASNVALVPVLSYWTFQPGVARTPDDWWVPDCFDFLGLDIYARRSRSASEPYDPKYHITAMPGWEAWKAWAKSKGMRYAVGEWGNRGDTPEIAVEMFDFYDVLRADNALGAAYFDSGANSPLGPWTMGPTVLDQFHFLMEQPTSVNGVA